MTREATMRKTIFAGALSIATIISAIAAQAQELTVYSGRGESFAGPIFKIFEEQTGIKIKARYGSTAELSALLKEEGAKSPADVFLAQDAGALIENRPLFADAPKALSETVLPQFRSNDPKWLATSGRARTLAYSKERVKADQLPKSVFDLTKPEWKGKVGYSPKNASFQAFLTALRVQEGEEKAKAFVKGLVDNGAKTYANNVAIVQAIADGEIDAGLVNSYYLTRFVARDAKVPVAQTFFEKGDIGNLLFVSGAGIVETSKNKEDAAKLLDFFLSPAVQQHFASAIGEYPVIKGVIPNPTLTGPLATPTDYAPKVPLEKLGDVSATKKLLTELGLL